MTKEFLIETSKCVDFVAELIDYIAEYPDDDYMTMECLCRKLVKYDLIDKEDGYYLVDKGIKIAEQTEPQTDLLVTEYPQDGEVNLIIRDKTEAVVMAYDVYKELTEPQTDCSWQKGE